MKCWLLGLAFGLITLQVGAETLAGHEKSAMCAGCHGTQGNSLNPDWPSLAGQHATYLAKQLHDYKHASTRQAAMMTPMVAALTDQDITDLAAFYATLPRLSGTTPEKYLNRGEKLYRSGDSNKHITACIACHGPQGLGNEQAGFPTLSGQQPAYTIQQLEAFKNKTRTNDLNSIMQDISARLDHDDMEAVAYYLFGIK